MSTTTTCPAGAAQLKGTLEGATVSGEYPGPSSYSFIEAAQGKPGSVSFGFGSGGRLTLTWTELVADDQSTAASGELTIPAGGPLAGQAFCVSAATVTPRSMSEGGGASFVLSTLVSGLCAGVSVSGSVEGCVSPSK
jgi:hypothetical protein